ncbi:MAG: DNA gyrase subunit A [Ardenticatenaceae bacterium]|nr:DNA gyrase subunit A [Ardenticatenaceae bacterium]
MSEVGIVKQIDINAEMQEAYLDYAMSVIVSRALPDVRDGLKPVHRRILYAMYDMGLRPERPYKKSARIVGEVLGKYHPHGDSAVYDAMVRMAQDFSMRYLLVDGQGNFGSVDGDAAAAMRYTEARLAPAALEMLADIEKNTVEFSDNFDGSLTEPLVLPARLPNLLVNGASGIAVGMSTNVPPHNLGEVCDALIYMIDHYRNVDEITVEDLLEFIQGPDFPTGGIVYRYRDDRNHDGTDTILNAYATGRGSLVVQAKTHVEEMSRGRARIVVTELPYQTNKSNLIERIADLAREGRIEGITDLRDESDRRGMRVVIELTRNVEPREVLAQLFKLTPLRQTFGVILLALVDGQPRMLSLKRVLQLYLQHRQEVIRRRSEYDLERARARAHILEGLRIALDRLDEVITTIRRSRTTDTARTNLIKRFSLTEAQATAILDMQLRRLAQLERRKIEEEYQELVELIDYLIDLLKHPAKILKVIKTDLEELKQRYGDLRRTQIVTEAEYTGEVRHDELISDTDVLVTITQRGEIQRWVNGADRPRSGGEYSHIITANNRNDLLLLSTRGRGYRFPVHQLPEKTGRSNGESLHQLISGFNRDEEVAAVLEIPAEARGKEESPGNVYLVMVTRQGKVMRADAKELGSIYAGSAVINVDDADALLWAGLSGGEDDLILVSRKGMGIRFREDEVRSMGLGAMGVNGIKLEARDDIVVGAGFTRRGDELFVVTEQGFGKRTPLSDYGLQGRYGKGLQAMRLNPKRTGPLAAAAVVRDSDRLTLFSDKRAANDVLMRHIAIAGRPSIGEVVFELPKGQVVAGALKWGESSEWLAGTESASPREEVVPAPRSAKSREAKAKKTATARKSSVSKKGPTAGRRTRQKRSAETGTAGTRSVADDAKEVTPTRRRSRRHSASTRDAAEETKPAKTTRAPASSRRKPTASRNESGATSEPDSSAKGRRGRRRSS